MARLSFPSSRIRTSTTTRQRLISAARSLALSVVVSASPGHATVYEFNGSALAAINGHGHQQETRTGQSAAETTEQGLGASTRASLRRMAEAAARRQGIPPGLYLNLIRQESAWNPRAVSSKGAYGLAQLMPATARILGVDRRDPAENLEGGARYLAMMRARFGSWALALAAYNAGPGAVVRHGGVPPYRETRTYIARILADQALAPIGARQGLSLQSTHTGEHRAVHTGVGLSVQEFAH